MAAVIERGFLSGAVIRWLPFNLAAVAFLLFWQPVAWQSVIVLLLSNALAAFGVGRFIYRQRLLSLKLEKNPVDFTLQIANETLPFLRRGLNEETAAKIVEIIQKISDVAAIALTDREKVLAYIGAGDDHHKTGGPILTEATRIALFTGELKVVENRRDLRCPFSGCPLESAVIAPLKCKGEVVGTLKLYQTEQGRIPEGMIKLAVGVAQLLGMQMELAELNRQAQLVTKAELEALRAQINPHFLFNTLNTIIMFIRTNPETARRLLIRLSSFFRYALKRSGHFNTLKEEIEYLNTYLILEKARFGEKLQIAKEIDETILPCRVPVLTIQPLVENAIKHGILPKSGRGTVKIIACPVNGEMLVAVHDDGVGIQPERLPEIFKHDVGSGNGVGLSNVHERLKSLFGEDYGLKIVSTPNVGTSVYVRIPLIRNFFDEEGKTNEAKSIDRG
ncbi:MAG TPA: sensor histidine kinase [Desulfotomaculum sp.]|jgi:two-component system LytT family sensor kinase|nr:sensor histidine kinase [Desulfotomaculum sp.]